MFRINWKIVLCDWLWEEEEKKKKILPPRFPTFPQSTFFPNSTNVNRKNTSLEKNLFQNIRRKINILLLIPTLQHLLNLFPISHVKHGWNSNRQLCAKKRRLWNEVSAQCFCAPQQNPDLLLQHHHHQQQQQQQQQNQQQHHRAINILASSIHHHTHETQLTDTFNIPLHPFSQSFPHLWFVFRFKSDFKRRQP